MFSRPLAQPNQSKNFPSLTNLCYLFLSSQTRCVSNSPYGRSHVWKRRRPVLPNPVVPIYPQQVILADGSSFTHYISSPRSKIRLTRDVTNNPLWNYGIKKGGMFEDEQGSSGRMGRFARKFEEFSGSMDWMTENVDLSEELQQQSPKEAKEAKK